MKSDYTGIAGPPDASSEKRLAHIDLFERFERVGVNHEAGDPDPISAP
jgi:hypothetical protein